MKAGRFLELYGHFGKDVALSALLASRFWRANALKHKCILRWLKKNYAGLIDSYRGTPSTPARNNNLPVWTMWWQGEGNLPDVVRICLDSVKKNCGTRPLRVITSENFGEYVSLPGYVIDKFREGRITITHLSDIARFFLLSNYGGLWLDSTVFISGGIPGSFFEAEYCTVKRALTPRNRNVAQDRWTNFLHAAWPGCVLCKFVLDFFLEYWKTQGTLIDYFLIDYAIEIAYSELPQCRKILDAVPSMECDLYGLEDVMNCEWSPELWESVKASAAFSKLSWRKGGKLKTFSGRETVFAHLLRECES